ncbi:MAG TPA: glycosyltransferase family 9 protein [Chthoniobacterales bacterium]
MSASSHILRPNARVLVICHKQLGDMTLLEPALRKLSLAAGRPVELLTRSGHAPLISLMEGVKMTGRAWLRTFDAIFCYDDLDKSAVHAMLAWSPRKDLLLRSPLEVTKWNRRAFFEIRAPGIADAYLARYNWDYTVADSGESWRPPVLKSPADAWRPADFRETDYVLLNSTAGWKSKRWKSSAWVEVAEALLAAGVPRIVVTSGGQDWQREHSEKIAKPLGDRALYLGGQTRLEEFLWLTSRARMVIGVDGAASHLSAAFGGKNLTLFFRTNPHNWHFPTGKSVALLAAAVDDADETNPEYGFDPAAVAATAATLLRS